MNQDPDTGSKLDWFVAMGLAIVTLLIGVAINRVDALIQLARLDSLGALEMGTLLVTAAVLGFMWYKAPSDEIRLFGRIGRGVMPAIPGYTLPLILVTAAAFLLLMFSSIWPALFGVVLLVIVLVNSWNALLAKRIIQDRLELIWGAASLPVEQVNRGVTLISGKARPT